MVSSSRLAQAARRTSSLLLALSGLLALCTPAHADGIDLFGRGQFTSEARFASGIGTGVFLAAGTLLPLVEGGQHKTQQSARVADSLFTATLLTEALKRVAHERRPDGSDDKSFPSEHATAAFAVATMQSHYHPRQAPLWYASAALIGASRVQLNKHYWHDVLAGAAIGFTTARLELRSRRGLLLRPLIDSDRDELGLHAAALDGLAARSTFNVAPRQGFSPSLGQFDGKRSLGFTFARSF